MCEVFLLIYNYFYAFLVIQDVYSLLLTLFQGGKASRKLTAYICLWNATVLCAEPVRVVQQVWGYSTVPVLNTTFIVTLIHSLQLETRRPT
jgi:hypothetical protein